MESVPHLCGVPPKTHNPSLLTRKTSGKPRVSVKCLANIPQDCMTNKEKLRNCHTSKETEETWCLDAVWCLGLDPGREKVHEWKYW